MDDIKTIIIKIENENIFFNETYFISLNSTNFPAGVKFKTHDPIYWELEMKDYTSVGNILRVDIKKYNSKEISRFLKQIPKNEIRKLEFSGYDWQQLEPQLMVYYTNSFPEQIAYRNQKEAQMGTLKKLSHISHSNMPFIRTIQDEFYVSFEEAKFMEGYISFTRKIKQLNQSFDFIIANEHFLPAFDNIKGWFIKKLKKKRFHVKATFTEVDFKVQEFEAKSEDISIIDKNFIDSIKLSRTIAISERPRYKGDKSLFTKEEIFSVISESGLEENVFGQTEKEIISLLAENFNVRNRPQLEFLSANAQSENYPIKYTLHPDFGFLFTVINGDDCFFVWELLNSHATYIWQFQIGPHGMDHLTTALEREINLVRDIKRENYKKKFLSQKPDQFHFKVINHTKSDLDKLNDFNTWKQKIDAIIYAH